MPSGGEYRFGPYRLDLRSLRLLRNDVPIPLQPRPLDLLLVFLERPGALLTKDELIALAWKGTAVDDNTLASIVLQLRRALDTEGDPSHIENVPRRGYRFIASVSRAEPATAVVNIDALLEPHRVWIDGRAALETLSLVEIERARADFEPLVTTYPDDATFRVGLANACALQFESTRTDLEPDRFALEQAVTHAERACQLRAQLRGGLGHTRLRARPIGPSCRCTGRARPSDFTRP